MVATERNGGRMWCRRPSQIIGPRKITTWLNHQQYYVQLGARKYFDVLDIIVIGYHRRRKNRNSQRAYGAVVDNSIKVETTRSLATEFSELCSRKRLG
eukprot:scaffold6536_cov83-Skeletonema_dohrnii-CCMP3373.AAC.4